MKIIMLRIILVVAGLATAYATETYSQDAWLHKFGGAALFLSVFYGCGLQKLRFSPHRRSS